MRLPSPNAIFLPLAAAPFARPVAIIWSPMPTLCRPVGEFLPPFVSELYVLIPSEPRPTLGEVDTLRIDLVRRMSRYPIPLLPKLPDLVVRQPVESVQHAAWNRVHVIDRERLIRG